ncbi:uncharacterized [Tachysurus ichikawai]
MLFKSGVKVPAKFDDTMKNSGTSSDTILQSKNASDMMRVKCVELQAFSQRRDEPSSAFTVKSTVQITHARNLQRNNGTSELMLELQRRLRGHLTLMDCK